MDGTRKSRAEREEKRKATLRERLAERLEATSKSAHAVSKEIGANAGYVRDLLDPNKTTWPKSRRMDDLAQALGTTPEYLEGKVATPDLVRSEVTIGAAPEFLRSPQQGWQAAPDERIPVLGTAFCDDLVLETEGSDTIEIERIMLETDHTIHMVARPPALWNVQDAYAIYFHGSSMEPRYYQGELGIVNPRRPPGPGDFVVVQMNDGESDDVVTVLVKQLVRMSTSHVELRQFNPELSFRIPRSRVARLHRICSPGELYS